jgi:hypothetical protein
VCFGRGKKLVLVVCCLLLSRDSQFSFFDGAALKRNRKSCEHRLGLLTNGAPFER